MASIKITRTSEYVNKARQIKLFLDGNQIDIIANNETKLIEVSPGNHTIQAKIDWCSSNKVGFDVSDNEIKSFALSGFSNGRRPGGFQILYYIIFASNKFLVLKETADRFD